MGALHCVDGEFRPGLVVVLGWAASSALDLGEVLAAIAAHSAFYQPLGLVELLPIVVELGRFLLPSGQDVSSVVVSSH